MRRANKRDELGNAKLQAEDVMAQSAHSDAERPRGFDRPRSLEYNPVRCGARSGNRASAVQTSEVRAEELTQENHRLKDFERQRDVVAETTRQLNGDNKARQEARGNPADVERA